MNRKLFLAILVGFTVASLAACGGGSSSNPIQIAFNQSPPADLQVSGTASVSAAVFNTSTTGVNWTVTCGSADCGSFSATNVDSNIATTYTAPATVPSGNTVTITATAVAKSSVSVSATVTITTGSTGTALNGQYTFLVSGVDFNLVNYVAAGSFVADGNGNITSGEEDFCDIGTECFTILVSGNFSTGLDGRGSINLSNSTANAPFASQTLEIVVTSSSHALITEFDSVATSSGTLDLQDPTALAASAITGGYSMTLNGLDLGQDIPNAFGAVMTGDGSGGFNNVTLDENDNGSFSTGGDTFLVQSGPDPFGRVTVGDGSLVFAYYIVNAKALRVIELDDFFQTSGSAYTEGSGTLSVASLAGSSVFTVADQTSKGPAGVGGEFTADSSGNVSAGFMDVNDGGSVANGSISGSSLATTGARGTFSLAGGVSSDITSFQVYLIDPGVNILDPTQSTGGGGALLLDTDSGAVGTGEIIPQGSGAQFNGNYGANLQAFSSTSELDLEAQLAASGSANLNGTGDLNEFDLSNQTAQTFPAQTLSGTFTTDANNAGRFTGSLMIGTAGTVQLVYYQATNSQIVILEVDGGQVGTGVLVAQQ
jgi:hypothetical protein